MNVTNSKQNSISKKPDIVILSPDIDMYFSESDKERLSNFGNLKFVTKPHSLNEHPELKDSPTDKIIALNPDFCDWEFKADDIDKISNTKAICLQTSSFSWIDTKHAASKNIPITNLHGFPTEAVSEWLFMMALNLARKVPLMIKEGFTKDFEKFKGIELRGRTAGIVGLGKIGTDLAEICKNFGMDVIYWSKNTRDPRYKYEELDNLMKTADVIFVGLVVNEETSKLITDKHLKSMKKEAMIIVPYTPKELINHDLALKMVKNDEIYGYGFESSNEKEMHKLEGNVWSAPLLAWITEESLTRNRKMWIESIIRATQGEFPGRVN